jgi:hypothetical protein
MMHVCYAEKMSYFLFSCVQKKINVDPPSFFFIFLIRSFYKYLLHKTFILIVDKQYPV